MWLCRPIAAAQGPRDGPGRLPLCSTTCRAKPCTPPTASRLAACSRPRSYSLLRRLAVLRRAAGGMGTDLRAANITVAESLLVASLAGMGNVLLTNPIVSSALLLVSRAVLPRCEVLCVAPGMPAVRLIAATCPPSRAVDGRHAHAGSEPRQARGAGAGAGGRAAAEQVGHGGGWVAAALLLHAWAQFGALWCVGQRV